MLIAVLIFFFFRTKASTERFFSTILVVLDHDNAQNLIVKVLDLISHPLNLNLFGELLTLALTENCEKSHRCPTNCTFIKHKTKIGRTMIGKKFQLLYTAVILLPLKLQKIDCATRTFSKFTVL